MLNTSNEYKQYIADSVNSTLSRDFTARADIELADSTVLNVTEGDIVVKGLKISDSTSASGSFQIGSAIIGQCILMLNNIGGKFDQYDFTDAVIRPRVGLRLSETTEWLAKGVFTVDEPTLASSVISLVALDNMNKFDTPFSDVTILFPCTTLQLLQSVCIHCGVSLATVSFLNSNFVIERRPDDEAITCREIVSWIAQLSGNFARCNYNGALELKWYDYFPNALDGNGDTDIVDGNGVTDIVDGNAPVNYHHIYALGSSKIGTDDVVITGIQVKAMGTKEDYGETVLFGSPGYVIEITDNELITENTAATIANSVGVKIVGMQLRQFEGTALTDPSREAGDMAYLTDKKQNTYQILLSGINFEFGSLDKISCDAETPSRNSSVRYSAQTKAIVKARENVKKELTSYDIAVITLTEAIVNGLGLYQTVIGDEIEGRIIYQHDKPTMEQSVKRWFRTSEGYIQQTRPNTSSAWVTTSGQDIYGNAVYNTIATKGLNAEWIIAGIIASANNSSWFDLDNNSFSYANGALKYSPASGFEIDTPNTKLKDGNLTASNVDLTGKITSSSGDIGGWKIGPNGIYRNSGIWGTKGGMYFGKDGLSISDVFKVDTAGNGNFTGTVNATSGSFTGKIRSTDAEITGKITATSGSFTGSINSSSANITGGNINMNTASELASLIQLNYGAYSSRLGATQLRIDSSGIRSVVSYLSHYIADSNNAVISSMGQTGFYTSQNVSCSNLAVTGTKNRIVKTKNYGEVLLNAYETPRPTFADTGHGIIGEDGLCYIDIEVVFYETIDTTHDYRYFLTKYGQGDLWIDKSLSTKEYFVVGGTVGLEFDWKIEAIQRDYNTHNLEKFENSINEEMESDYTSLASNYLEEYEKELILC